LHLSLSAIGASQNDEIIVPAFTWVATANAVEYLNAKPVLCDINLDTFNIDINSLNKKISGKTKGIIPVHLFGLSADMDAVSGFAEKNNLWIIEDAACGFGTKYKNTHVGNFGNMGCFSFHPRKAITTGEGGMITTNKSELTVLLRSLRDHGATYNDFQKNQKSKPYMLPEFPHLGYNYRMTDIQASIGSSQMDRAEDILSRRIEIAGLYDKFLSNISWLRSPFKGKNYSHSYQSYVCLFEPGKIKLENVNKINKQRNEFMDYLQSNGISTRPGTHSIHLLKYYKDKYKFEPEDFPNALIADKCSIALPLFPGLMKKELEYIFSKISNYKIKNVR
jgi:dTDP-4-amino-4,6-dideoxygalactose transaminase